MSQLETETQPNMELASGCQHEVFLQFLSERYRLFPEGEEVSYLKGSKRFEYSIRRLINLVQYGYLKQNFFVDLSFLNSKKEAKKRCRVEVEDGELNSTCTQLVETGMFTFFEKLQAKLPEPLCAMCGFTSTEKVLACIECDTFYCSSKHLHPDFTHANSHFLAHSHCIGIDVTNCTLSCVLCDKFVVNKTVLLIKQAAIEEIKWKLYNRVDRYAFDILRDKVNFENLTETNCKKLPCNKVRGIKNLGNTCFMNVVLQTLAHNPSFISKLHPLKPICPQCTCSLCELKYLYKKYFDGEDQIAPLVPTRFLETVWRNDLEESSDSNSSSLPANFSELAGYEQQDSHEFFISLTNRLHRDWTTHHADERYFCNRQSCNCPIHSLFEGQLQSTVTCTKCKSVSTTIDPFLDCALDIPNPDSVPFTSAEVVDLALDNLDLECLPKIQEDISLVHCLENFCSKETLGKSNYFCQTCQTKTEATKQLQFYKLPPTLVFQLKRFSNNSNPNPPNVNSNSNANPNLNNNHLIKTELDIYIPHTLSMDPFTFNFPLQKSKRFKKDTNFKPFHCQLKQVYHLYAIIHHSGTLNGGHYTVYLKVNNHWFLSSDTQLTLVNSNLVSSAKAYMCFYTLDQ